ncbi:MAG TPA: DUF4331 family protein [Xanthomonadales bacterium]|nr:DUF4331 family protein [Xanthomonadales bacterium]
MKTLMRSLMILLLLVALPASAADHLDSPLVQFDPAADINDVYAFMNPNNPGELILIATVMPLADENSRFSDAVEYRFNIQNLASNEKYVVACKAFGKADEFMTCELDNMTGRRIFARFGTQTGNDKSKLRMYAGLRDDPFFFDLAAYRQTVATAAPQFTNPGTDFFAGLGTLAIVVGIDSELLTAGGVNPVLSVYASSHRLRNQFGLATDNRIVRVNNQVDRKGRPAVNTALIDLFGTAPAMKDAYNTNDDPASWNQFIPEMQLNLSILDTLDGVSGNALLPADVLATVLAEDRLLIDTSQPVCDAYLAVELGVPQCGGRTLQRDVIDDTFGAVVGPGVSDFVGDSNYYLADFPFLSSP